jgi:hypothetical protein
MADSVRRECALCGLVDYDVRPVVVRWLDDSFEAIERCRDREACYRRVEAKGRQWPVVDGAK